MRRSLFLYCTIAFTLIWETTGQCTGYSSKANCPFPETIKPAIQLPGCGLHRPSENSVFFAVVGDYGASGNGCEEVVARLLNELITKYGDVDFILTAGDNNYWSGSCSSIVANIQQFYGNYYPAGAQCVNPSAPKKIVAMKSEAENKVRFFPTLGNHDWDTYSQYGVSKLPYIQHFPFLTSYSPYVNGEYYNVDPIVASHSDKPLTGLMELFSLNSNVQSGESYIQQQQWLQNALSNSTAKWKIVYFHHSPFTTAHHDPPATWMEWPFLEWGASMVISGHEHTYERILSNNFTYVVNGLGGNPWLYEITNQEGCVPVEGSQLRYNAAHGLMLGFADGENLSFCFYSVENGGKIVDEFSFHRNQQQ